MPKKEINKNKVSNKTNKKKNTNKSKTNTNKSKTNNNTNTNTNTSKNGKKMTGTGKDNKLVYKNKNNKAKNKENKQNKQKKANKQNKQMGGYSRICPSKGDERIIKPDGDNATNFFKTGVIDEKGRDSDVSDYDKIVDYGTLNPGLPPYPPVEECSIM